MVYQVLLADSALGFIDAHVYSERILARIETYIDLLGDYSYLGAVYDPDYPSPKPPIGCRQLSIPDTPFTLFYCVDEARSTVNVLYIDFSTGDPLKRFHPSR